MIAHHAAEPPLGFGRQAAGDAAILSSASLSPVVDADLLPTVLAISSVIYYDKNNRYPSFP